jgi:tetratricopeptide (TPR) repeat protein
MADRRIKVIWGGAERQPGEWRWGVLGTYERNPGSRVRDVALSVRGLVRWAAGFAVAGYLAGTAALFFWFDSRPMNQVRYVDTLLLPVRWSHVQELRGRTYIEEGLADLRARKWADAQMKLRLGLAKYPRDLRARLALSQFYTMAERRPLALALLRDGLVFGYPGRSYLETLVRAATEGEDFEVIIRACDQFLPTQKDDYNWLLAQKLQALIGDRRAAEALRLAEAQANPTPAINEARVMALLDLGRFQEAADFLGAWLAAAPAQRAQIVRLQVRTYRELRQLGPMERALEEMRSLDPTNPRPYVYGVVQWWMAGAPAAAEDALERYFMRFGGTPANLQMMAEPLAEAKAARLLQRCADEAAGHGFELKPFTSAMALLLLQSGDAAGTRKVLEKLKPTIAKGNPAEQFWFDWMGQLAEVTLAAEDSPATSLVGLLQSRPLPMKTFRLSAAVLMKAERFQAARAVLALAERNYPTSQTLAAMRTEIETALAARQARAVAPVAVALEQSEKAFFQQLEELETNRRWADAAQALRSVRVAKPKWLAGRNADVLLGQMRVAVETGDMLELLGAAKTYLDGSNARSQRGVALAQRLHERGAPGDAELLLAEVFRRSPDFPPARRLRDEWKAEAAKLRDGKK